MDSHNNSSRGWPQQPHHLAHQPSNITEVGDTDGTGAVLRGRESLVSLQSQYVQPSPQTHGGDYEGHTYTSTSSWGATFNYLASGAYAPVAPRTVISPKSHRSSFASRHNQAIHDSDNEENYDLSLLRTAAPMAWTPKYEAIAEDDTDAPTVFDVTTTMGPIGFQNDHFVKKMQAEEAGGNLTGGLGQGFRADTTVRDADLLSSPTATTSTNRLSRKFSRRASTKQLNRAETIRAMGQTEANRRGEVIKVIFEQDNVAAADLSLMEGSNPAAAHQIRHATFPSKEQATQTFYPQPNWRPFSMRWPYLTMLIVVSIALAIMQEILFRRFTKNPIIRFKSPEDVDPELYFAVKFAPTLSAVVYGVLWQFLDFEVRRLEAYYQLSKEGGALAAESINVDYVTSFNLLRPFQALKLGHYAVALSSIATTLAISLIPTFAAASVILSPNREERMKDPDGEKTVQFSAIWTHLLAVTLIINAAIGCGLLYVLGRRRSGLLADVRGIAGLASMAVVSHILMDFRGMDTATPQEIHHKLKHHRYSLRNSSLAPDDETPISTNDPKKYQDDLVSQNPHPLMLRPAGSIPFIIGLLLFTGFIPAFLFSPAEIITDRAAWVVTALAVCLKLSWNAMETAVRMMEPYYVLSGRHASSRTLGLDYTALPFGYFPIRALMNRHYLVFSVGFGSVMTEFLTILVTGLATVDGQDFINDMDKKNPASGTDKRLGSGQETVRSFYTSFVLSMFILVYMSVVATIVFYRRRHPFLPRQPNTIASILAFIHQSKMLYDFVGTEKMSNAERMDRLAQTGKTYGLGWFQGRDGKDHCGVDEEELIEQYKHGKTFLSGNQPWNDQWDILEYTAA